MQHIVSITSQGQLTIPAKIRQELGIEGHTKAVIERKGDQLIVTPTEDFWSLAGSMQSSISLSDKELKEARGNFSKKWARKI